MLTLDGTERVLSGDMLVIADEDRSVAIAGVMGSANSEITPDTTSVLLEAANFVATIEHRQGFKIACLEEIALRKGMINRKQFIHLSEELSKSAYGGYLEMVLRDLDG